MRNKQTLKKEKAMHLSAMADVSRQEKVEEPPQSLQLEELLEV